MRCKKCPSHMSIETVNGEKRWVCADCGYSCDYKKSGSFSLPKPLLIGGFVLVALALLALLGQ